MEKSVCARLLEQAVRASSCFDKVAVLCLIGPFATSLMLRSLSSLAQLYSQYTHSPQPSFMPSPAYIFVLCIAILVSITTTSRSRDRKGMSVPSHLLHLPFHPVQAATFTSPDQCLITRDQRPSHVLHLPFNPVQDDSTFPSPPCPVAEKAPPGIRKMPKSSSHPCLTSRYQLHTAQNENAPTNARTTLVRTSSQDTFFSGIKPRHADCSASLGAAESLSDEEINRRFSAFIESRFAAMKREMTE